MRIIPSNKMISGRALHYVLKIGDRGANEHFFRRILGMKVFNLYDLHYKKVWKHTHNVVNNKSSNMFLRWINDSY